MGAYLQFAFRRSLHCCRWWPAWKSRLRYTRVPDRSRLHCLWTVSTWSLCSHRSCSCRVPAHRSRKPRRIWNPCHRGPGKNYIYKNNSMLLQYTKKFNSWHYRRQWIQGTIKVPIPVTQIFFHDTDQKLMFTTSIIESESKAIGC